MFSTRRHASEAVSQPSSLRRGFVWFACAYVTHLLVSAWLYPTLLSRSQLWAELGPNYLYNAYYAGFWSNLATRDYVYYPLVVRLLALLVHACQVPLSEAGFVLNIVGWLFVNACNASFCLPYFRRWVRSDALRCGLTFGLLLYDSYFVRAPINIAYPAFVPVCFLLADLAHVTQLSRSKRVASWVFMALMVPSKPIYIATIPTLAFHMWQGARRQNKQLLIYATSLLAVAVTSFFLLDRNGPGGSRALNPLTLGATASAWMLKAIGLGIGGRVWLIASSQNIKQFFGPRSILRWLAAQSPVFLIYAAGAAAACIALVVAIRRQRHPLLLKTAAHFLVIGIVCAAMTFSSQQFAPPSSLFDFQKRELYAPAILAFMCVGMAFAHAVEMSRMNAAWMVPWMIGSFPFGVPPPPQEPSWPCLQRSNWKQVIDTPRLIRTGRSCATMDPIPWAMTGPDCQALWAPPTYEDWTTLKKFWDRQPTTVFAAPTDAAFWEVDSVAALLRVQQSETIRLTLRDAMQRVVGTSDIEAHTDDHVASFIFEHPVRCVQSAEFVTLSGRPLGVAMAARAHTQPTWFWFGRGLARACKDSVAALD